MSITLVHADHFFRTARERYEIKLRREAGQQFPWTTDPIFRDWSFTNVHREDDRTTKWFRENVRDPLSRDGDKLKIVEATMCFRWFNRISTGQMIIDLLRYQWDTAIARSRLTGINPVVTGAYIIKAGDGVSKLEGILDCIDNARPQLPAMVTKWSQPYDVDHPEPRVTLREAWIDLKQIHFLGGFMAYEIVTDLRHTPVLNKATDIMTWGNLGPGAIRGIGRVVAGDAELFANSATQQKMMLDLMAQLLALSKDQMYWPQQWPAWEMHECEMWLCEYAKYCNAMDGLRLKRRYKPS